MHTLTLIINYNVTGSCSSFWTQHITRMKQRLLTRIKQVVKKNQTKVVIGYKTMHYKNQTKVIIVTFQSSMKKKFVYVDTF